MRGWNRVKFLAWWAALWTLVVRYRAAAIALALLALLLVVAAFNHGWIKPPAWYTPPQTADAARSAEQAERAARAASASRLAAETAANSARFAGEGSVSSARAAASSARASASSATAAKVSERKSEAAAVRAEKAVQASSKSEKRRAVRPAAESKPAPPPARRSAEAVKPQAAAVVPAASGGFRWEHFGRDPYASSRDEAMRTRESAFRKLGFPEPVVAMLMIATERPGEMTRIHVGDKLDAMLSRGGVVHKTVTVAFGSPVRGMEFAAPAEKWTVTWEGRTYTVLLPEVCNNWSSMIAVVPSAPVAKALPPVPRLIAKSSECPDGWSLIANVWQLTSLPPDMRREAESLIAAAEARESDNARRLEPYKPDAVSRTMGRRLREQVKVRAPMNADITVRFIDPQTARVVRELGILRAVNGIGIFRFDEDPRPYIVETLWPVGYDSPTMSGGERRIRLFGSEWKGICAMNEHGLVRGR